MLKNFNYGIISLKLQLDTLKKWGYFLIISALTEQKLDINTAKNINSIVLAYIGDSVHSLYVRTKLIINTALNAHDMHNLSSSYVNAASQARAYENFAQEFTEEETAVFKRARNCKNNQSAKNASITDYRKATGFEAVLGYLYLSGQTERLNYILDKSAYKKLSEV